MFFHLKMLCRLGRSHVNADMVVTRLKVLSLALGSFWYQNEVCTASDGQDMDENVEFHRFVDYR